MNNEIAKIDGCVTQALRVVARAEAVIANAQSHDFPYAGLNHATRIFCAILATQARELAERATRQVGLVLKDAQDEDRAATVEAFFNDSAAHVDTDVSSMATARLAAQKAFTKMAVDLVGRAELVLEQEQTLDGRQITHGALWYK
ncbi:MAG: hypothetical protein SGJ27_08745 [Candidatus Melainabacteria bacterium]|nr:hypothetical protein [Candidatus Melainabacteria bacterium]